MEETGCEVICSVPTTLAVKGISEGEEDYQKIFIFVHEIAACIT